MESPRSAPDSDSEMQALPARPVVKKTYGKPKPEKPTMHLQADQSFSSDLTSLSQLSQVPPSSAPRQHVAQPTLTADSDSEGDDVENKAHMDSGFHATMPKSIKDMLADVDKSFDAAEEGEVPLLFSVPHREEMAADQQETDTCNKRERVISGASLSSTNDPHGIARQHLASTSSPRQADAHVTSPPTSPGSHSKPTAASPEDVEDSAIPFHSRISFKSQRRILDSEDEDEEQASAVKEVPQSQENARNPALLASGNKLIDSDEEQDINLNNESDDELPSLADASKKRHPTAVFSDDEEEVETQKTEAIEEFDDSQVYQSNRASASPDGKKKSRKPRASTAVYSGSIRCDTNCA